MGLAEISALTEWGLLCWLGAMALLVLYRCLNGGISLSGILAQDAEHNAQGRPSPERVQLLAMFLFALVAYAKLALEAAHGHVLTSLPDVPNELLVLFAGSNGIYLSAKLGRTILSNRGR